MSNVYTKAVAVTLLSLLLSGCAVYIRDDYHHRDRYHRHWRGSVDSQSPAATQLALSHEVHQLDRSTASAL